MGPHTSVTSVIGRKIMSLVPLALNSTDEASLPIDRIPTAETPRDPEHQEPVQQKLHTMIRPFDARVRTERDDHRAANRFGT